MVHGPQFRFSALHPVVRRGAVSALTGVSLVTSSARTFQYQVELDPAAGVEVQASDGAEFVPL
jgi:hypothetical protein